MHCSDILSVLAFFSLSIADFLSLPFNFLDFSFSLYKYISLLLIHLSICRCQDGSTSLMLASYEGHTKVVQLLLNEGASIDMMDNVRLQYSLLALLDIYWSKI